MPSKNFRAGLKSMGGGLQDNYGELPASEGSSQNQLSERLLQKIEKATEGLPIFEIEIVKLENNPYQHLARPDNLNPEALEELVSSIRQRGFYGTLVARRKPNAIEKYQLAYGHRRRAAALEAGLSSLPVKILDLSDSELFEIMASENLVRDDLSSIGQANLVGHLYSTENMTLEQIGKVLHKKRGWCQLRLSLYEAPDEIKEMVTRRPDSLSYVNLVKQVPDVVERRSLVEAVVAEGITRNELQKRIDFVLSTSHISNSPQGDNDIDETTQKDIVINSTSDTPMTASEIYHNPGDIEEVEEEEKPELENLAKNKPLGKLLETNISRLKKAATSLETLILTNPGSRDVENLNTQELRVIAERITFLANTLS